MICFFKWKSYGAPLFIFKSKKSASFGYHSVRILSSEIIHLWYICLLFGVLYFIQKDELVETLSPKKYAWHIFSQPVILQFRANHLLRMKTQKK